MKNLRRILSMVLAFCIMLSFNANFASAAVYTDVADSDKYAEAINLLSGLGIVVGYGDSFRPEDTITRAEAATIMVRVLGLEDGVEQGETPFSDVPASHWASGYINTAVANGIVVGFPEGTFCPEDEVTYEQIVKMVVCAIGHELRALSYDTYPLGYIQAASNAKVTKGVSGYVGMKAPRGLVSQIIYNALEVEMMDATSYNNGILGTSYSYNGKTILRDYLDIEKVDAVVTDSYLAGSTYDARDKFVELDITKTYSLNNPIYDAGDKVDFEESKFAPSAIYLGYAVTAYVGEDDGVDTIFAITPDTDRNVEVEITKDKFYATESNNKVLSYSRRATDKKLTEIELDSKVTVVVNGEIVSDDVDEYFDSFDTITVVNNDKDDEYDIVFISTFDTTEGVEFVVTEIDEDDGYYLFDGKNGSLELDYEDEDTIITIIRDGEVADADEIEIGDVITCLDASRSILTVYVSSDVVSGSVDELDALEGEYTINDEIYKLSAAFDEKLNVGDKGMFYLNYQGKIAYSTVSSKAVAGNYVFITGLGIEYELNTPVYKIQAVNAKGEVVIYTLREEKVKLVDTKGNMYKKLTDEEAYDYITLAKNDLSAKYNVNGYVGAAKIKVTSKGLLSEIYLPGTYDEFYEQTKYASANDKEYSEKRGRYGTFDITDDMLAFRVNDNETSITKAVEVGYATDFFTDGDSYMFLGYGERSEEFDAIVITDGVATADYTAHAVLVTKISQVSADDEPTDKITGLQNGKSVTYIVDPDESFDVRVGNIILVSENSKGYVHKLEVVADTTKDEDDLYNAFDAVDVPSDSDAGVFGGMLTNRTSKYFEIDGMEDSFYYEDNTSYYVIDYTGKATTFEKGSATSVKTNSKRGTYVIVRTYEEEAVDVFVFYTSLGIDVPTTDIWDVKAPIEEETATEPTEAPTVDPTEATAPSETETVAPTEATTPSETETAAPTEATAPSETETAAPTEATAPSETETAASTEATTPSETETEVTTEATTPSETETEATTEATVPSETETAAPTEATVPSETETVAPTEATTPSETETVATTEATTPSETETAAPTEATVPSETETAASTEATVPSETETATPTDGPILAEVTTEAATAPAEKKVVVDAKLAGEVLALINAERVKAGLPMLTWDKAIAAVAETHGVDMATNNYLDQKNKSGKTVENRLTDAKVVFTKAAENLAKGKYTSTVIVDAWMKSEKHKANILNAEFTKVGISVAVALDGTLYWVVDFVK